MSYIISWSWKETKAKNNIPQLITQRQNIPNNRTFKRSKIIELNNLIQKDPKTMAFLLFQQNAAAQNLILPWWLCTQPKRPQTFHGHATFNLKQLNSGGDQGTSRLAALLRASSWGNCNRFKSSNQRHASSKLNFLVYRLIHHEQPNFIPSIETM